MQQIRGKRIQNTALLFILIAPISIVFYASYLFNPANAGNPYLYPIQVTADAITMLVLCMLWLTLLLDLLQPEYNKRDVVYHPDFLQKHPLSVDILVPVVRESVDIVEHTLQAISHLTYPHTLYVLDDGGMFATEYLAKKYEAVYIARPSEKKQFAKAGNLNYALQFCKGEFFVVFDADHAPIAHFMQEVLPFFEDPSVALVQTPQSFHNTETFIAKGSAQAQEIFYKYIQPAKNSFNAAFCVGTNVVYRRSAIDEIGGIPTIEHSEDIWTSLRLHEKGYQTIFYNKVLAKGYTPDTISSYFRQQNRWSLGGFSLFFQHNPLFAKNLTMDQRLQYFFTSFFYFSTFALIIYLVLPLIYLLFGVHPMNLANGNQWLIHYVPYFITLYFLPIFLVGRLHIATISVSMASFAPVTKSFISILFNKKHHWVPTHIHSNKFSVRMLQIWPHVLLIVLSLIAVFVGWVSPTNIMTTFVTSLWVLINAFLLFEFVKNGILQEYR